jgi:hypothetical protein
MSSSVSTRNPVRIASSVSLGMKNVTSRIRSTSRFLARLALGGVAKSSIEQWNPSAYAIDPDSDNAAVYRRRYATFRKLYPRIQDLMHGLGSNFEASERG